MKLKKDNMKILTKKSLDYQIRNKYIKEQERELYEYAYTILFEEFINIVIAFAIGLFLGQLNVVICFLCSYIPLRRFSGGYHAENGIKCGIVSTLLIVVLCILNDLNIIESIESSVYIFLIICQICIFILSPIDSVNKPLSYDQKQKYHKNSVIILLFQILILNFAICMNIRFLYMGISYSHIVLFFMLIVGKYKNNIKKYDIN